MYVGGRWISPFEVTFVCLFTEEWEDRWIQSKHKSDYGEFKWTAGKFYGDAEKDKGIQSHALITFEED